MNDGFTGYNESQCEKDLNAFTDYCNSIYIKCGKAVQVLNLALVANWTSPKAVEINNELKEKTNIIGNSISHMCNQIFLNAQGAIRYLALQNGATFRGADGIMLGGNNFFHNNWVDLQESGIYGVGMNKTRVKDVILVDFENSINEAVSMFDSIPLDLAVYDPTNSIIDTYRNLINTSKEEVINEINDIKTFVISSMQGEMDRLEIGVRQATQELAG